MDIQLKRGVVEICVLAVMLRGETYGYQLIKEIEPHMDISESTLYPILKRLESGGCLTVRSAEHNGRLRKYYAIAEKGRERIADFLSDWEDISKAYAFIKGEFEHAQE